MQEHYENGAPTKEQWIEALKIQARVIYALMLRETKTIFGRSRLGYMLHVIQVGMSVLVFWALRSFIGMHISSGLSLPLFLLSGYTVWNIFSSSVNKCMNAIDANKSLLYFSRVQTVDLLLARVILIFATDILVLIIFLVAFFIFGIEFHIYTLWPILFSCMMAAVLGLGLGALLSSLAKYFPGLQVGVKVVLRFMFFTGGVIIESSRIPQAAMDYLQYNPVLILTEYSRLTFHANYPTPPLHFAYLGFFTIAALSIGFFAERITRHKMV